MRRAPATAPTPSIPAVNGTYSGTVTIVYPEIPATLVCPASTTVTQSGRTVNIAPIVLGGQCGGISIPVGQATIDNTGAIDGGSATGTLNQPSCGLYNFSISGGFFGREFQLSAVYTSSTCLNFNLTMVLTR